MEGLRNIVQKASDAKAMMASVDSVNSKQVFASPEQSRVLIPRPPRNAVSFLTCSKLCAAFFVCGVVVGYTLKRRVRKWLSRLLRRLKDD